MNCIFDFRHQIAPCTFNHLVFKNKTIFKAQKTKSTFLSIYNFGLFVYLYPIASKKIFLGRVMRSQNLKILTVKKVDVYLFEIVPI